MSGTLECEILRNQNRFLFAHANMLRARMGLPPLTREFGKLRASEPVSPGWTSLLNGANIQRSGWPILNFLMTKPDWVFSHDQIIAATDAKTLNSVFWRVKRIRDALRLANAGIEIRAVYGQGYAARVIDADTGAENSLSITVSSF